MKALFIAATLLAVSGFVQAQQFDCAAQSQHVEPAGWAAQCASTVVQLPPSNAPHVPTDTAFAVNLRSTPDNLVSFTINAFGTQTTRGPVPDTLYSGDFNPAGTTYYVVNDALRQLGTLNLTTGAFTLVAPVTGIAAGQTVVGMAIHPRTGVAYLASGITGAATLYTLDLTTGVATTVAPITGGISLVIALAQNCEGAMYLHDIGTDSIYSLNTTTGVATLLGLTGVNSNFAQGMDFDNSDGVLYAYTYQGAGANQFGTINLTTGALTSLATNAANVEEEGAIPTVCPALDADVTITKTAQAGALTIGAAFTYTLVAGNTGPAAATGVVVTDVLPPEVTYVSNDCGAAFASGTVTWNVGGLANAASATCIINVTVAQAGPISNTATITATTNDPDTSDNSSTANLAGVPLTADLSLIKTSNAPSPLSLGTQFDYTLTVSNAGPGPASSVVVTDALPANVTYVSNTCGAAFAAGTVTWNVGTLNSGASANCSIRVTATGTGTISNTATATSATTDPVGTNNSGTVVLGGVVVPVLPVPAASTWSLLLLALGFLGLAVLLQRRS